MNELDKARKIEASDEIRTEALTRFSDQIEKWGITIPDTNPLVLDFGLDNFYSTGLIECWIANEVQAGYCGKYLFLFDGQSCPMHHHRYKHETFFVIEGKVQFMLNAVKIEKQRGEILPVPLHSKHSFMAIGPVLLLELSQPCIIDDNYFENQKIPIGGYFHKTS